jgi:hypothetical protein
MGVAVPEVDVGMKMMAIITMARGIDVMNTGTGGRAARERDIETTVVAAAIVLIGLEIRIEMTSVTVRGTEKGVETRIITVK